MEGRKAIGATSGAVGFGGLAAALAACCGAPWAVGIFGVAGAVILARLAFLQPYALTAMALLLLGAFWFAYRRPTAPEGAACDPVARRRLRWFVWGGAIVAAILAVAAVFPLLFV